MTACIVLSVRSCGVLFGSSQGWGDGVGVFVFWLSGRVCRSVIVFVVYLLTMETLLCRPLVFMLHLL